MLGKFLRNRRRYFVGFLEDFFLVHTIIFYFIIFAKNFAARVVKKENSRSNNKINN